MIQDIKINQGVTIGSGDADPILFCPLGKKGCPPEFFRDLYAELTFQTLQLFNTSFYI